MPVQFENPIWLILLLALPPAFIGWHRFLRSPGVAGPTKAVAYLRTLVLLSLILALAGARLAVPQGTDVFFVLDISHSISAEAQLRSMDFIRQSAALAGRKDRTALVAFAAQAYLDRPPGSDLRQLRTIESIPAKTDTNLEAALQLLLAQADPERPTKVVLMTDGQETLGNAETLIPRFQQLNIPIDVFLLEAHPENEAAIEEVQAPARTGQDQPFQVRVNAISTYYGPARLRLFRDGRLFADSAVNLRQGYNVFVYEGIKEEPGVHRFEARLEAAADTFTENNAGYAVVVTEGPHRMLFVTESLDASQALISALDRQGVHLDVITPHQLPANPTLLTAYAAVLLHDVSALRLSQTQMTALASYVRNLGGGLLTIGGRQSYGLGGYMKTPLEEALPVTMDAPQTLVMPSLALVLVLDRSGSMGERQGQYTKLDLAKEAAVGVLDVLAENDLLGVLAFDNENIWPVPLQPVRNHSAIAGNVRALSPGGGTDLGPAMEEAYQVLRQAQAMVKHLVILSDGLSLEADFEGLTNRLRSAGVTVSTVAVGKGADVRLLEDIARWGAGRFHFTEDAAAIPQIFVGEALVVSRPLAVEETVVPVIGQYASFLSGPSLTDLPQLDGYVLTTPKASAAIHIETAEGHPLLASWRYGLGRAAAFTSGATVAWASSWLDWPGFAPFWAQLSRWVMRPDTQSELKPVLDVHAGIGTITVDIIDQEGRFVNFVPLVAEITAPDGTGEVLPLSQTAPGRYQAEFRAGQQGSWLVSVSSPDHPLYQTPALIGTVLPYSPEYRWNQAGQSLLERLAARTGGQVISGPEVPPTSRLEAIFRHPKPARGSVPIRTYLLIFAFVLFFLDICLRYLPPGLLISWMEAWSRPLTELRKKAPDFHFRRFR